MPSYKRPGVYAEEVLNLSAAFTAPSSGRAAFIGANGRGPVQPKLVSSWSEYLQHFGGFSSTLLPHALHQFFSNGGREAYVMRVAGPGITAWAPAGTAPTGYASRTLMDRAGTPLATLRVDAANPGTWAQQIFVEVSDVAPDRFSLTVRHGGAGDQYIVERWAELSMDPNDGRYAVSMINSPAAGSSYIRVYDANSATTAPNDRPAVLAATALTGGTDPAVTNAELSAAVATTGSPFDVVDGPLVINMPGITDAESGVLSTLLAYCANRGDSFAVIDTAENDSVANAIAQATGLPSSYGAIYYPWIYIVDPASTALNATRKVPPGGAVVGQYLRTDTVRGVHKAPAGTDTRLAGVVGVETRLTNTNLDDLNTGLVNAIRHLPGVGVVIMGARTLRSAQSDRYVSTRRTLNYIRKALLDNTQWAVFEPNDQTLWAGLRTNIEQFLLTLWQRGALRGGSHEEAFYVKCDAENNTPQSIAQGQVNIEVGVALQYPAEFIVIRIGQWEGGSTATVAA